MVGAQMLAYSDSADVAAGGAVSGSGACGGICGFAGNSGGVAVGSPDVVRRSPARHGPSLSIRPLGIVIGIAASLAV